jgi:hypothetical protein
MLVEMGGKKGKLTLRRGSVSASFSRRRNRIIKQVTAVSSPFMVGSHNQRKTVSKIA